MSISSYDTYVTQAAVSIVETLGSYDYFQVILFNINAKTLISTDTTMIKATQTNKE